MVSGRFVRFYAKKRGGAAVIKLAKAVMRSGPGMVEGGQGKNKACIIRIRRLLLFLSY